MIVAHIACKNVQLAGRNSVTLIFNLMAALRYQRRGSVEVLCNSQAAIRCTGDHTVRETENKVPQ
jgi:hypothetical protein